MEESVSKELTDQGFALIETHISRVYLGRDEVFKTKRPVELGFLDFRSLAARERACEAEVTLNRRLAPDVYLGVVVLVRDEHGRLCFRARDQVGSSEPLDYAVHMRRLPDEARADVRLARGLLDRAELEQIARLLARFHRDARHDEETARFGDARSIACNVEENFAQIQTFERDHLAASEVEAIERTQRDFLAMHAQVFAGRAGDGFVRDGHGDLRLEHIYRMDDGSHVIIDCIEFNDRFRFADVCADIAFLSMDLRSHGRADLAELLLAAYAEETSDYALYALIDFYESYRAFVRGKVASFLAHDSSVAPEVREGARAAARRHFLLALACSRPALSQARLLVCMGMIASGKSKLANQLGTKLGLAVLCADRLRKRLMEVAPEQPLRDAAFAGAYAPEMSERVYTELRARARALIRSGRSAIVDATFRERRQRILLLELATSLSVQVLFLECRCSRAAALARLRARAERPHVSDGRIEIYDDLAARFEPTSELLPTQHVVLDTERPAEQVRDAALALLD